MDNQTPLQPKIQANEMANFILDVGLFLMASGAHSGRVRRNCSRIAQHWGFSMNINPTFTGMLVSVWDESDRDNAVTLYKTSPSNVIHFEILTLISRLSWSIADGDVSFDQARRELDNIKSRQHYRYWVIALAVGISCACLCMLAGGNWVDASFAFVGAAVGSAVRYVISKNRFNAFLSIIIASFITTMIVGMDTIWGLGASPELTLATAVLYLIPGVPLINSVIDLLEGYFSASVSRSMFAASCLLSIAVGMTLSIMVLGINNF